MYFYTVKYEQHILNENHIDKECKSSIHSLPGKCEQHRVPTDDECLQEGCAPDRANKVKNTNTKIQIQKYKYKNTNTKIQIQKYKYKNTNTKTQIQKYKYKNTNTKI